MHYLVPLEQISKRVIGPRGYQPPTLSYPAHAHTRARARAARTNTLHLLYVRFNIRSIRFYLFIYFCHFYK